MPDPQQTQYRQPFNQWGQYPADQNADADDAQAQAQQRANDINQIGGIDTSAPEQSNMGRPFGNIPYLTRPDSIPNLTMKVQRQAEGNDPFGQLISSGGEMIHDAAMDYGEGEINPNYYDAINAAHDYGRNIKNVFKGHQAEFGDGGIRDRNDVYNLDSRFGENVGLSPADIEEIRGDGLRAEHDIDAADERGEYHNTKDMANSPTRDLAEIYSTALGQYRADPDNFDDNQFYQLRRIHHELARRGLPTEMWNAGRYDTDEEGNRFVETPHASFEEELEHELRRHRDAFHGFHEDVPDFVKRTSRFSDIGRREEDEEEARLEREKERQQRELERNYDAGSDDAGSGDGGWGSGRGFGKSSRTFSFFDSRGRGGRRGVQSDDEDIYVKTPAMPEPSTRDEGPGVFERLRNRFMDWRNRPRDMWEPFEPDVEHEMDEEQFPDASFLGAIDSPLPAEPAEPPAPPAEEPPTYTAPPAAEPAEPPAPPAPRPHFVVPPEPQGEPPRREPQFPAPAEPQAPRARFTVRPAPAIAHAAAPVGEPNPRLAGRRREKVYLPLKLLRTNEIQSMSNPQLKALERDLLMHAHYYERLEGKATVQRGIDAQLKHIRTEMHRRVLDPTIRPLPPHLAEQERQRIAAAQESVRREGAHRMYGYRPPREGQEPELNPNWRRRDPRAIRAALSAEPREEAHYRGAVPELQAPRPAMPVRDEGFARQAPDVQQPAPAATRRRRMAQPLLPTAYGGGELRMDDTQPREPAQIGAVPAERPARRGGLMDWWRRQMDARARRREERERRYFDAGYPDFEEFSEVGEGRPNLRTYRQAAPLIPRTERSLNDIGAIL